MNSLIILTGNFPYNSGEQFLETEIMSWADTKFNKIYIIPNNNQGEIRLVPENIEVLDRHSVKGKKRFALLALLNPILYRELLYLLKNKRDHKILDCIKYAIKSTALVLKDAKELKKTLRKISEDKIIVYSYWNDISSYAACLLKQKGLVENIFSRSHRFDLYEEERPNNYMPLKRQFVNEYDKVYLLAENAVAYYHRKYKSHLKNLEIARLGVLIPSTPKTHTNLKDKLNILSLSNCIPVKQIDLIMSALQIYSIRNPKTSIHWCHIGGGPLYNFFKKKSKEVEREFNNLELSFIGELTNSEVKQHLQANDYNFMINASKSEGIPVSIMEAMSYCIPAIAPDVGGVSDLVNSDNGYLMPSICTEEDILQGIDYIRNNKILDLRINAYKMVSERFNAVKNYNEFKKEIELLAKI